MLTGVGVLVEVRRRAARHDGQFVEQRAQPCAVLILYALLLQRRTALRRVYMYYCCNGTALRRSYS